MSKVETGEKIIIIKYVPPYGLRVGQIFTCQYYSDRDDAIYIDRKRYVFDWEYMSLEEFWNESGR